MTDIIVIAVVVVIAFFAVRYIVRAKKSGKKCIGCPNSEACRAAKNGGCCLPGTQTQEDTEKN